MLVKMLIQLTPFTYIWPISLQTSPFHEVSKSVCNLTCFNQFLWDPLFVGTKLTQPNWEAQWCSSRLAALQRPRPWCDPDYKCCLCEVCTFSL